MPFTIRGSRPPFAPALPWLSDFHEINVRPWTLFQGRLELESDVAEGDGLPPLSGEPLAHAAGPIDVELFGPSAAPRPTAP